MMSQKDPRRELHELVDRLPADAIDAAKRVLAALCHFPGPPSYTKVGGDSNAGLRLSDSQIEALSKAIQPFLGTRPPELGCWKAKSDDKLWMYVVLQVCVVGRADSAKRMKQDPKAKKELTWNRLVGLEDHAVQKVLWTTLRRNSVRYVAAEMSKDNKSKALVWNLRVLEGYGGPREYFGQIAKEFQSDESRVRKVMGDLAYIKDKGARDLLVELGLVKDVVALDVRVQNVLEALGIETHESMTKGAGYDAVEAALRQALPHLGVDSLAHLDRILFGHMKDVIAGITAYYEQRIPSE